MRPLDAKPIEECPLHERELAVVRLIALGLGQKQVAHELGISFSTIRSRTQKGRRIFGVASTAQLVIKVRDSGWLDEQLGEYDDSAPLSPGEALYVAAFDAYGGAASGSVAEVSALATKDHMLSAMYLEAHIPRSPFAGQLQELGYGPHGPFRPLRDQ